MILMAARERSQSMPKHYKLLPVDVMAIQITDEDSVERAVLWAGGAPSTTELAVLVPTMYGTLKVGKGDYLVKYYGTGAFEKMSAEEFESRAELV